MDEILRSKIRFRRQWAILEQGDPIPEARWIRRQLGEGRWLFIHEDAVFSEYEVGGFKLYVIGIAVHPDDAGSSEWVGRVRDLQELEKEVINLCGQYAVIAASGSHTIVFTDPGAMHGIYFGDGRAASSPSLLPGLSRDARVDSNYTFQGTDDWYTGSLCPFINVRFLLANHCLDVSRGVVRRFWAPDCRLPLGREEGIFESAEIIRKTVARLPEFGRVLLSLTGGRDSRVNLAASRGCLDRIDAFTLVAPTVKACDQEIPRELAERFGFRYNQIGIPASDAELIQLYDEVSAGLAQGARRDILSACIKLESRDSIHLNGNLGAITKSFFWPGPNPGTVKVDALMREFTNKATVLREGVNEWLESLPEGLSPAVVYSLMYLEQRGGRWMSPGENASSLFYTPVTPFNSRLLFETICRMPLDCQYGGFLLNSIAHCLWPEVAAHRYCRNTRNLTSFLPRSLKSKKIRDLLGVFQKKRT
jgi:hypothetical protein